MEVDSAIDRANGYPVFLRYLLRSFTLPEASPDIASRRVISIPESGNFCPTVEVPEDFVICLGGPRLGSWLTMSVEIVRLISAPSN